MSLDWQRVTEIFGSAITRNPDARVAYLAQACCEDDELGAEITGLLAAHDLVGNFLTPSAFIVADPAPEEESEYVGRKLGPYQIEGTLGAGTRGVVLLAEDTRTQTRVIMKTLPPTAARDAGLREYLGRESAAVAAIGHPNIGPIRGIEEVYGQFYLVGDYVAGSTLRSLIDRGPIRPGTVAAIGLQVAEALGAAHRAGLTHRNIKPENIVCSDSGVVSVLDFGMIRAPEVQTARTPTRGAAPASESPAYLSPEQLEGTSVDLRSDLFALGVVMYEMLTGRNPFAAPTPEGTAAKVKTVEPPPASALRTSIPKAFDRVLHQCLEKDREKRYRDSADVVRDLNAMITELPDQEDEAADAAPSSAAQGKAATAKPPKAGAGRAQGRVSSARASWAMHQLLVITGYLAATYFMWQGKRADHGRFALALFVVMVAAAAVNGFLRMQLLTTERLGAAEFGALYRRIAPVIALLDWMAVLALLLMAFSVAWSSPATGVTLGAFAILLAIVSIAVDPSKARAAFPSLAAAAGTPIRSQPL